MDYTATWPNGILTPFGLVSRQDSGGRYFNGWRSFKEDVAQWLPRRHQQRKLQQRRGHPQKGRLQRERPRRSVEVVLDTNNPEMPAQPDMACTSTAGALYTSPNEALKGVQESYHYWTGKLTDTSLQLSYALLASNWAVFGSVNGILNSFWSKLSIASVIVGLVINVAGAKIIGELALDRINYAEADSSRWKAEFDKNCGKRDPWPFTGRIETMACAMREARLWLPLAAGVFFLVALVTHWAA